MSGMIVPADESGDLQISDEMKKDAAASVANMDVRERPYLYLCNPDAKVVVERKEAAAGDFVILGAGDKAINLGEKPMFIVLSQHKRFSYYEGRGQDRKLVWDVHSEALNDQQAAQADLKWSDPRSAKPYDAYMLLHLTGEAIDPHKVGPISFKSSAHTAKCSREWISAIVAQASRGVPAFAAVWQLEGYLADTGHGSSRFRFKHTAAGGIPDSHEAYPLLKESWQHAQLLLNQAKSASPASTTATNVSNTPTSAQEASDRAVEQFASQGSDYGDYATGLPDDGELDPPF